MKLNYKIFFIIICLVFSCYNTNAETLEGNVNFTWDKLSQTQRDNDIEEIKTKLFDNNVIYKYEKSIFKDTYKNYKKDENYRDNVILAKSGITENENEIIVPFYLKKLLLGYGIIYKKDLKHCYYYDALGHLFVVEIFQNNYGEYPTISYQYDKNGKLIGSVYALNKYDDYMYDNKEVFVGRWYKENCYGQNGKVKMTRNLPD